MLASCRGQPSVLYKRGQDERNSPEVEKLGTLSGEMLSKSEGRKGSFFKSAMSGGRLLARYWGSFFSSGMHQACICSLKALHMSEESHKMMGSQHRQELFRGIRHVQRAVSWPVQCLHIVVYYQIDPPPLSRSSNCVPISYQFSFHEALLMTRMDRSRACKPQSKRD